MIPPKMLAMITQVVQSSTVSSGSLFLTTGQRPKEDNRDSSSSAEFPLKKKNQFIVIIGNVFKVMQVVLAYEP